MNSFKEFEKQIKESSKLCHINKKELKALYNNLELIALKYNISVPEATYRMRRKILEV